MKNTQALPIPTVLIPEYNLGSFGKWQITTVPVPSNVRGYFNGAHPDADKTTVVLSEIRKDEPRPRAWMSFTPMETESHSLHILSASGDVVVCGLGLGMYLYNILRKPSVSSVTVIEKDPAVITLFKAVSNYMAWEGVSKLTILNDDALEPKTPEAQALTKPDFLYVDIWEVAGCSTAQRDTRKICKWIQPIKAGWWTQEADIISFYAKRSIPSTFILDPNISLAAERMFRVYSEIPIVGNGVCSANNLPHYGEYLYNFGVELVNQTVLGDLV